MTRAGKTYLRIAGNRLRNNDKMGESMIKELLSTGDISEIEEYVNEEVVQQKEAVIQAALIERGFVPVVQEDGSIAFQKEPAPIPYPQEPVSI